MVDFGKLRLRTDEERAARQALLQAEFDLQDALIDQLQELVNNGELLGWPLGFARSACHDYRVYSFLSDKQWTKVREILGVKCSK